MNKFCVESNANRVKVTEHRISGIAKETRRSLRSDKKKKEEENKAWERQLHDAGIGD